MRNEITSLAIIQTKLDNLKRRVDVLPSFPALNDKLQELQAVANCLVEESKKQVVLKSLYFEEMRVGEDIVKDALESSFEWIWDTNFLEWLKSGSRISGSQEKLDQESRR